MEWLLFSWPTLILLGLGLRMALRLHYGARGPEPGDPVHDFLRSSLQLGPDALCACPGDFGRHIHILRLDHRGLGSCDASRNRHAASGRSASIDLHAAGIACRAQEPLDSSVLTVRQTMRGRVGRAAKKLFDSLNAGTPLRKQ